MSNGNENPLFKFRNDGYLFINNKNYSEIELLVIPNGRNLISSYYQKIIDGISGVEGSKDASETLNVTIELLKRGYTEVKIGKLWSGNLLRILDKAQEIERGEDV